VPNVARMDEGSWHQSAGVPGLMRAARGWYGRVIAASMAEAGFDDMPRNGALALAVLVGGGGLDHLSADLGVRKQLLPDLIDTMVRRGYLERVADAQDSGRVVVRPTERGRAADRIGSEAAARVDGRLRERLGADGFESFCDGLRALAELRAEFGHLADGGQAPGPRPGD
jgi:DNA-binding MarR family transcriptional regulator